MRSLEDLAQCHTVLRRRLERASEMAQAVVVEHKPPACRAFLCLRRLFLEISSELQCYLDLEQTALLPAMWGSTGWQHFMEMPETIRLLCRAQDAILSLISEICEATQGFEAPGDSCAAYAAFLDALRAIQAEALQQFHLENEKIFPNALALAEVSVN